MARAKTPRCDKVAGTSGACRMDGEGAGYAVFRLLGSPQSPHVENVQFFNDKILRHGASKEYAQQWRIVGSKVEEKDLPNSTHVPR